MHDEHQRHEADQHEVAERLGELRAEAQERARVRHELEAHDAAEQRDAARRRATAPATCFAAWSQPTHASSTNENTQR